MATIGKLTVNTKNTDVERKIHGTSLRIKRKNYFSPTFYFANSSWCLKIFPNGNKEIGAVGFTDLFACRETFGRPINLEMSLGLKTVDGKMYKKTVFTSAFKRKTGGWGFSPFLSRSEVFEKDLQLLPSDVLTLFCTVTEVNSSKPATAESSSDEEELNAKTISSDEAKSTEGPMIGSKCLNDVLSKDLVDQACQTDRTEDDTGTAGCSYCKKNLDSEKYSSHETTCTDKQITCPKCSHIIVLEEQYDHQYQLTGTESISTKDDGSLTEDYKKVLLDGRHHNVILKIGDKELRAHNDILRARSRVFESMLDHDMKEKNSGIIDIPDCDPQAMELFLSYVYCGKIESLDQNTMLGLYYIADKYDMQSLKSDCCEFIKKSLSATNICDVIQLALSHSDTALLEYATEYFMTNALDIFRTVEWQSFLKDNSTVGNELLIKSFEKLKAGTTEC